MSFVLFSVARREDHFSAGSPCLYVPKASSTRGEDKMKATLVRGLTSVQTAWSCPTTARHGMVLTAAIATGYSLGGRGPPSPGGKAAMAPSSAEVKNWWSCDSIPPRLDGVMLDVLFNNSVLASLSGPRHQKASHKEYPLLAFYDV